MHPLTTEGALYPSVTLLRVEIVHECTNSNSKESTFFQMTAIRTEVTYSWYNMIYRCIPKKKLIQKLSFSSEIE
jgi:hypothetical protein